MDFGKENGAKLAAKWDQKSMLTSKSRFYKSTYKTNRISMIFEVPGVEKSIKNRLKIDPKTRSTWEGIFAPIFLRFWWFLGAKLGGKIEPRSKKKCIENMMQNKSRLERVLDRFWPDFGRQNQTLGVPLGYYGPLIFALKISFVLDIVFGRPKTLLAIPQTLPRRVF